MSIQSLERAAKALSTIKSSAEHVRSSASSGNVKRLERSTTDSSNANPPSAMSKPTPDLTRKRSTRLLNANSTALLIRGSNRSTRILTNRSSLPKPVSSVRSTSTVSRGSPHLCKASPPMKQKRQPCSRHAVWSSVAARITSITAPRHHEPALLFDQPGGRFRGTRSDLIIGRAAQ